MSTHPNVMLFCILTPDDLSRKTYRAIVAEYCSEGDIEDPHITIDTIEFRILLMEEDYDDNFQLAAPAGSIVLMDMITYGYGSTIEWNEATELKEALENTAKLICAKFNCSSYTIKLSANYW